MQYLCLIYQNEKILNALSKQDYDALVAEALAYDDVLREGGHYVGSNALELVGSATTIRVGSGKASVTDGPFAETREQLGGYILIEARDLNEAIRLASGIPSARLGCVEVRPVKDLLDGVRLS